PGADDVSVRGGCYCLVRGRDAGVVSLARADALHEAGRVVGDIDRQRRAGVLPGVAAGVDRRAAHRIHTDHESARLVGRRLTRVARDDVGVLLVAGIGGAALQPVGVEALARRAVEDTVRRVRAVFARVHVGAEVAALSLFELGERTREDDLSERLTR